jgi:hypothetical protein
MDIRPLDLIEKRVRGASKITVPETGQSDAATENAAWIA